MRRLFAILLMLLVPLQFAWSAEQGVRGHAGDDLAALAIHVHDADHHHADAHDSLAAADLDGSHNDDGHHESHYHPVFSSLLVEPGLSLAEASPGGLASRPPASFISRIPPLFDRPPAARA